ncbi:MAG: sugar ABC transporter permease [Ruminococcaceae bacterium]|nr:sugar ABC transporter permease [Oscillospiraceae bacterium]
MNLKSVEGSAATIVAAKPAKRKNVSLDKKKAKAGWLFVLPFVLGFILIYLPIIKDSIVFSFSKITVASSEWIGFDNYQAVVKNSQVIQTLVSSLKDLILDIPAIVIFSLFMAVMLNQKMLGRAAFRAIFFIPVILSTGLIDQINHSDSSLMDQMQQEVDTGGTGSSASEIIAAADIAKLFSAMQIGTGLVKYVTNLVNEIYDIINRSGVQMLIFLAGLQSISPAIYESCSIDGATAWETFWKITFPMISPMILVNSIYTVIDSFTSSDNEMMTMIYDTFNGKGPITNAGSRAISSAMGWLYFIIVIAIIGVVAAVLSAYVFYQRRD